MPEVAKRPNRNITGPRIKLGRLQGKRPLTQQQLSSKLSVKGVLLDRAAIAKIENGFRGIYDFELVAIADVLRVDVNWLLSRSGKSNSRSQG